MEDAVNPDAGSAPAAVETTSPAQSAPAPAASENHIPHSRVQEMIARREAKLKAEYEAQLAPYKQQAEGWNKFSDTFLRGVGLKKDPQPEYVDKQTFEKTFEERFTSLEQKNRAEREYERASAQLEQAKDKYRDAFEVPGFEDYCISQYTANPNKSLLAIADEAAQAQKKYLDNLWAKRQAEYATAKTEAVKTQPIKSGGGVSSSAPAKEKMPKNRTERESYIQKKLRSYRGE